MVVQATRSTLEMGKAPCDGSQTLSIHEMWTHVLTRLDPSKSPPLMPDMGGLSYAPNCSGWCLTARQTGRSTLAADSPGTAVPVDEGRGCDDSRERRRGYVTVEGRAGSLERRLSTYRPYSVAAPGATRWLGSQ